MLQESTLSDMSILFWFYFISKIETGTRRKAGKKGTEKNRKEVSTP